MAIFSTWICHLLKPSSYDHDEIKPENDNSYIKLTELLGIVNISIELVSLSNKENM